MRLYDLHTGEVVPKLPLRIEPGRYRLLEPATLNDVAELAVGDMLWSDGGTRCELQDVRGQCWSSVFTPISVEESAAWALVDQGVRIVAGMVRQAAPDTPPPAPLMPESLAQQAQPTAFELELERVLEDGHLHEISMHPRMAMRYDAEILPISRARRVATGALMRLASRSEDWHRRTLSGIEPARVLAEVSDDEWSIYENVVFARLLDQAKRLLVRRQRQLSFLIERQAAALNLNQTENLHHLLSKSLCTLWGQAWTQESRSHDLLQERLNTLEQLINRLKQLRFSRLYQAIPRSARVPLALKNTNIMLYDRHYRELRQVWQLAHKDETEALARPAERIRQRIEQHRHHGAFVGLLIRHVLKKLTECEILKPAETGFRFGAATLQIEETHATEWTLTLRNPGRCPRTLTFAAAWSGTSDWATKSDSTQYCRQVIYSHGPYSSDCAQHHPGTGEDSVLNPLQFYAVERIKARVEHWLYRDVILHYPPLIPVLPDKLVAALIQRDAQVFEKHGKGVRILRVPEKILSAEELVQLCKQFNSNLDSQEQILQALNEVRLIGTCRVCGKETDRRNIQVDRKIPSYKARCDCGHKWSISKSKNLISNASFYFENCSSFALTGSLELHYQINHDD